MSAGLPVKRRSRLSLWLAILSAAFIVYGTTIPFRFFPNRRLILARWHRLTFNPLFPNVSGKPIAIADAAQNILLFVPFGIFAAGALDRAHSPRRRLLVVVAAGAALSIAVESLQLLGLGRTSSFADVVTNTCGTAIGALASTSVLDALARFIRRLKLQGVLDAPTCFPLLVGVLLVCLAAWEPFNVTLETGSAWRKLMALARNPWRMDASVNQGVQLLRFLVLTVLTASWLRDLGTRQTTRVAVSACALVAVALELPQILIESRMPGLADVSVEAAGVAAGGLFLLAMRQLPSLEVWFVPLVASTWFVTLMPALTPRPSPPFQPFWVMSFGYPPFFGFRAWRHALEVVLLLFPLGFALPWVIRRTSGIYLGAIAVAVVFEGSLVMLIRWARTGNPTALDVVVAVLAALGGAWMGRQGRIWFLASIEALEPYSPRYASHRRIEGSVGRIRRQINEID